MDEEGGSNDPGEASHGVLWSIRQELERHPVVTKARGFPSESFTEVVAEIAVERWGIGREDATLTVRWFTGETRESKPEFSFHYSDDKTDFGWHHEPNPHVDGWGHFQERSGAGEDDYSYEPFTFPSENPSRLVWEIMAHVSARIQSE
ncbi:hypothetical protein ACFQDD_00650 [Halorubrum pallidum]|uniref:Uncharacterized protein n=1 Tax=Halorubrum pallidum TaxID=1526114 RepID=A0ABD5SZX6_9EURY